MDLRRIWVTTRLSVCDFLVPLLLASALVFIFIFRGTPEDAFSTFIFFSTLYFFWTGLFATCQIVNGAIESGEWAYWVLGTRRSIKTYLVAQTNGGDPMYLSETESAFTDPVVLAAVELIYNMMNVDGSSPTHADSVTQKLSQEGVFLAGKSAMTIGPWMVRSIKDLDNYPHDFVTAFAPYPVYAEGQRNFTQGGYGDMLCINPKSEHIEEAWEFIKWYATEGMLPVVEGGRVPCFNTYDPAEVTAAFLKGGEELLDSETTMTVLINPADNYAAPSITNHSAEIKRVFTEEMETILLGDETPAEGMAKAKERADAILQQ